MFTKIDDTISVAAQIAPAEIAAAAAQGFTTIVNNRPDGEQPEQPTGAEIAAAAAAAGLDYRAIPISHAGFSEDQVIAMREALEATDGPVLAFCRSGTRSTFVWALARSRMGDAADDLVSKAAAAGYDISPLRPMLRG